MPFPAKTSSRFDRAYKKLNPKDQKDVDDAITAMMEDPTQGWLRTKKIQNARSIKPPVYEASANGNIRISWQYLEEKDEEDNTIKVIFFRSGQPRYHAEQSVKR